MNQTKTALISVFHKNGIDTFARDLKNLGWTIISSGGTAKYLKEAGIEVKDTADLVGGAILGHRVVTLSREIHAGLLSRETKEDNDELEKLKIPRIDLVCVDLYPLETEIAKDGSTYESVNELTDIGGPTMIRSALKGNRIVVCDVNDRNVVIEKLKSGTMDDCFIKELGAKGEYIVSKYTLASAKYRGKYEGIYGEQVAVCKYGENAWQTPAGLFSTNLNDPLSLDKFKIIEGTAPSYNNWCDIDRLLQTMTHIVAGHDLNFSKIPFVAIGAKHGNPCGAGVTSTPKEALTKMMQGDPLAIFGGLIITNFPIDGELSDELSGKMLDGVIAPEVTVDAIEKLRRKGDKCRFVTNSALSNLSKESLDIVPRFRYVRGGFLKQPNYTFILDLKHAELKKYGEGGSAGDLILAWAIGSTSNSNTIAIVKNGQLLGNGVGQQDRVGAAKLGLMRANRSNHDTKGATAFSDSFFPFPDGPQELISGGITTILTTSGSKNDNLTIELCQKENVALYMIPDSLGRGFFGH